jgi:chitinase
MPSHLMLTQNRKQQQSPGRGSVCYANAEEEFTPDADDEAASARNASGTQALSPRQTYYVEMPGWQNPANDPVNPETYFAVDSVNDMFDEKDFQFSCGPVDCHTCELYWDPRRRQCCGCVNMDIVYGFTDIDGCWFYTDCGGPPGERGYPGPIGPGLAGRSVDAEAAGISDKEQEQESELGEEGEDPHSLEKRAWGEATLSTKDVTTCGGTTISLGRNDRYPAFPAMHNYPWEGIQNGLWDPISRYWGNTSADCADWGISARGRADTRWANDQNGRPVQIRANYQSKQFPRPRLLLQSARHLTHLFLAEHVFEGQLIGDFFFWWLDQGRIRSQLPPPPAGRASTRFSCRDTNDWFLTANPAWPWRHRGRPARFINLLVAELGSITNLERLTIMLGRPNGKKGTVSFIARSLHAALVSQVSNHSNPARCSEVTSPRRTRGIQP